MIRQPQVVQIYTNFTLWFDRPCTSHSWNLPVCFWMRPGSCCYPRSWLHSQQSPLLLTAWINIEMAWPCCVVTSLLLLISQSLPSIFCLSGQPWQLAVYKHSIRCKLYYYLIALIYFTWQTDMISEYTTHWHFLNFFNAYCSLTEIMSTDQFSLQQFNTNMAEPYSFMALGKVTQQKCQLNIL